jgi:hypothetical protein
MPTKQGSLCLAQEAEQKAIQIKHHKPLFGNTEFDHKIVMIQCQSSHRERIAQHFSVKVQANSTRKEYVSSSKLKH